MRTCKYCYTSVEDDAIICPNCGKAIPEDNDIDLLFGLNTAAAQIVPDAPSNEIHDQSIPAETQQVPVTTEQVESREPQYPEQPTSNGSAPENKKKTKSKPRNSNGNDQAKSPKKRKTIMFVALAAVLIVGGIFAFPTVYDLLFKDETPPEITVSQKSVDVNVGTRVNYASYFTAHDDRDGDLTSKITIDSSGVQLDKGGQYTVRAKVSDEAGNTAHASMTVNVLYDAKWQPGMKKGVPCLTFTADQFVKAFNESADSKYSNINATYSSRYGNYQMRFKIVDFVDDSVMGTIDFSTFDDGTLYMANISVSWRNKYNMANTTKQWVKAVASDGSAYPNADKYYPYTWITDATVAAFKTMFPDKNATNLMVEMAKAIQDEYLIGLPPVKSFDEDQLSSCFRYNGYVFAYTAYSNGVTLSIMADVN